MKAGKLDRRITLERLAEVVSASGAVSEGWTPIATVRAELVRQSADEYLAGPGEAENKTVIFRIRWMAGLTLADRVSYQRETYDLEQIVEIGRRRGLELRAVSA